jgi:hypothetical protein
MFGTVVDFTEPNWYNTPMTNIHQTIEETENMLDDPLVRGELRDNVQEIIGNFYELLKVLSLMPDTQSLQATIDSMSDEIGTLIKERDEARREVCKWEAEDYIKEPVEEVAKRKGWDCFDDVSRNNEEKNVG